MGGSRASPEIPSSPVAFISVIIFGVDGTMTENTEQIRTRTCRTLIEHSEHLIEHCSTISNIDRSFRTCHVVACAALKLPQIDPTLGHCDHIEHRTDPALAA